MTCLPRHSLSTIVRHRLIAVLPAPFRSESVLIATYEGADAFVHAVDAKATATVPGSGVVWRIDSQYACGCWSGVKPTLDLMRNVRFAPDGSVLTDDVKGEPVPVPESVYQAWLGAQVKS